MRQSLIFSVIAASAVPAVGFSSRNNHRWGRREQLVTAEAATTTKSSMSTCLFSTVEERPTQSQSAAVSDSMREKIEQAVSSVDEETKIVPLSADEINARLEAQLDKMRQKDQTSRNLSKDELKIIYEDDHILVVDKPAGVLTVAGKVKENGNLAQSVYEALGRDVVDLPTCDHMIVHRLAMDSSGLIVMAKTMDAVRGLNGVFRERKVERHYEALVAGTMAMDEGLINLPLMRDYEKPPFVRVSTDDHQRALLHLRPEEVGKKLLELPKESLTKYEVVSREELNGQPVTRVKLTSITGRYHQLNAHMAAYGHPIIGDTVYGLNGEACPDGGLTESELADLAPNPNRASKDTQQMLSEAAKELGTCVHAKSIKFRHPVTKETVDLSSDAPF